ncbi:MAG: phosphatidate cytidylyltransferase [Clostridia bacterium]|nr:phosphatidate cytidylyltransferase [Clostridia bacterium]
MLKTRLITGMIGAALAVGIVLWGVLPLRISIAAIAMLMIYELFRAVRLHRTPVLLVPALLLTAALSAAVVPAEWEGMAVLVFLIILFVVLLFGFSSIHTKDVALAGLFTLFVGLFMGTLAKIRMQEDGIRLIWLVFIGAWGSDVFAYTAGRIFGRHKLIPKVSPKKTVEGAVGALVGTAIAFYIFGLCAKESLGVAPAFLGIMGIAASACGQIGDLVASAIKRQYGIKDYGTIFPGHGGAMDRFDSVLFVAPAIWILLQIAGRMG